MRTLKDFIDQAVLLYPNEMFDIVDHDGKFHYLSNSLSLLLDVKLDEINKSINYELLPLMERTNLINQQVIKTRKMYRFISRYKQKDDTCYVMRVVKYPLIDDDMVYGVMSMMRIVKLIRIEPGQVLHFNQIVFDLDNEKLNNLDKLILFYASIGFTQSEIYQSIVNLGNHLSLNGFKYHYNQLLVKTNATSIQQLISEDDNLRNKNFIPKFLIELHNQPILL